MKKILLLSVFGFLMILQGFSQTRYGFATKDYDSWNVNDPNAKVLIVVWPNNNDTLKDAVGSDVNAIDGSARNGIDFNFSGVKVTFAPGTNIFDSTNRRKIPLNITPNSTFYGKKDFYLVLTNYVGFPPENLTFQQSMLRIVIDYDGTNVGTPKLSVEEYNLYPVPASDKLFIDGVNPKSYKIYDLAGKLVQEESLMMGTSIDVSGLTNGMYMLYSETDKGMIIQKFMKQ